MKICVVGTGYVGLVGAAIFSDWGNRIIGVDIDVEKIERIKGGEMPIFEPGLSEIVLKNIKNGNLSFTTSLSEGMSDAEIVFICVGTPESDTGHADLSAIWKVSQEIGQNLGDYKVVVVKSTVPVGTNEKIKRIIKENLRIQTEFDVVSNPEFLREGYSVEDMMDPDRTVIGSDSERALSVMRRLYEHLGKPIVECDFRSAEMIKYASNAFLATKISFINEMGQLCERADANVNVVAKGMGLDNRIGPRFLNAGIGYGGSCFPKDVEALYKTSTDQAYDFKLIRGVMEVNSMQKDHFVSKITRYFGKNLSGKTFAILGLAFKQNTDDIRESVAIKVAKLLRGFGANLRVYDPEAMYNAKKELGDAGITYCLDKYEAIEGSDSLVILTEWPEFASLDLGRIKGMLKTSTIFDGRNLLDSEKVESLGFVYFCVGKRTNGLELLDKRPTGHPGVILKNGR
ncbi:UDP-glucose/GDP-mannose dehydrogenase family protein [Patescibacteria group bacterium]|nr:UDP-glucose/GDP-mannose dehydrogenase family protein [Patescibacteria group bacterium]